MTLHPAVRYAPHPDHPGWYSWAIPETGRFHETVSPLIARPDGERRGRCRMWVEDRHLNLGGAMHGGAVLTFIDMALYAGGHAAGADTGQAVTLDCAVQFIAPGRAGSPLDAEVELIRETGRLIFFRGLAVQGEAVVASFGATLRKARPGA